jgi:uncharacterized protein YdhG (YjbR/CyaY superfamily)
VSSIIDDYLDTQPPEQAELLRQIDSIIMAACPQATVKIGWGMPIYMFLGDLVGICGFKKHVSLFPMGSNRLTALEAEIAPYKHSKGTLQFQVGDKLPKPLIKKVIKMRMGDNLEKINQPKLKDGKPSGKHTAYYDNGEVNFTGSYRSGLMHGEWKFYRRDGSIMRSGFFKSGEQTGEWITYTRDGKIATRKTF